MINMLKSKINIKLIITLGIISLIFLFIPKNTYAALQSNGGNAATYTVDDWMVKTREMETSGGTLGLTDTINTTDLKSTLSNPNNIDIHMEKNTEYGALVILSASSYGNADKVESGGTTTGNATGVVMNLNKEWVAAGLDSMTQKFFTFASRYKNVYTDAYVAKKGDATVETDSWHGSTAKDWFQWVSCRLIRSYSGSIFSYYAAGTDSNWGPAYYTNKYASRAVVVAGEGF